MLSAIVIDQTAVEVIHTYDGENCSQFAKRNYDLTAGGLRWTEL